jgi:hypothetical protein
MSQMPVFFYLQRRQMKMAKLSVRQFYPLQLLSSDLVRVISEALVCIYHREYGGWICIVQGLLAESKCYHWVIDFLRLIYLGIGENIATHGAGAIGWDSENIHNIFSSVKNHCGTTDLSEILVSRVCGGSKILKNQKKSKKYLRVTGLLPLASSLHRTHCRCTWHVVQSI